MTCACGQTSISVPNTAVVTDKTTTEAFLPMTEPMACGGIDTVAYTMFLEAVTDDMEIRPAFQVSDDPSSFSGGVALTGTKSTSRGASDGALSVESSTESNQYIRFGVLVANATGATGVEAAYVALQLELLAY